MHDRPYIYIAAPYQGMDTHDYQSYFSIHTNIARAHEVSITLARLGFGFFCPHTHSAHNEVIAPDIPAAYWYELDLHFLDACDAVLVLPGESRGVQEELRYAERQGIPIYESIEALCAAFPLPGAQPCHPSTDLKGVSHA